MIDRYAQTFARDPDDVYQNADFDTVISFAWLWKEQQEYQSRYRSIEDMMKKSASTK